MGSHRQYGRSDLFIVRVWTVEGDKDKGEFEWHGKVQRVTNGEVHQWRSWPELLEWLLAMLSKQEGR